MHAGTLSLILFALQSPADPVAARQEKLALEKRDRAAAIAKLVKPWKSSEVGPFLVLSENQDALARETAADGVILWDWMEETFPYFAPESYAPAPILAVHGDEDGAIADGFVEGGFVFIGDGLYRLAIFPAGFTQSNVRRRLGEVWFESHDRDLYFALPGWMRAGFVEVFADSRTKGGKMLFKPAMETVMEFATAMQEGRLVPTRKFLKQPMPREGKNAETKDGRFSPSPQAAEFIRYLLVGKGAKGAKSKKVLPDYIAALKTRLPALSTEVDEALAKAGVARTDEKYSELRASEFEKLEARILPELFDQVFVGWTDKDWETMEDSYWYGKP
jgi:hypothetical protein